MKRILALLLAVLTLLPLLAACGGGGYVTEEEIQVVKKVWQHRRFVRLQQCMKQVYRLVVMVAVEIASSS